MEREEKRAKWSMRMGDEEGRWWAGRASGEGVRRAVMGRDERSEIGERDGARGGVEQHVIGLKPDVADTLGHIILGNTREGQMLSILRFLPSSSFHR